MHYLAASADPSHFLHTIANYLIGLGGGIAAVILIIIGAKLLFSTAGNRGGYGDEGGSGLRQAFEAGGHVLVGLFFIFGAFFIVGVITSIVTALQK